MQRQSSQKNCMLRLRYSCASARSDSFRTAVTWTPPAAGCGLFWNAVHGSLLSHRWDMAAKFQSVGLHATISDLLLSLRDYIFAGSILPAQCALSCNQPLKYPVPKVVLFRKASSDISERRLLTDLSFIFPAPSVPACTHSR
jgi:hypothetical protein